MLDLDINLSPLSISDITPSRTPKFDPFNHIEEKFDRPKSMQPDFIGTKFEFLKEPRERPKSMCFTDTWNTYIPKNHKNKDSPISGYIAKRNNRNSLPSANVSFHSSVIIK